MLVGAVPLAKHFFAYTFQNLTFPSYIMGLYVLYNKFRHNVSETSICLPRLGSKFLVQFDPLPKSP